MRRKEGRKGGGDEVDVVFIAPLDELTFTLQIASACLNRGWIAVESWCWRMIRFFFLFFFLPFVLSITLSLSLSLALSGRFGYFFFDFYTSFAQLRNAEINLIDSWNSWNQFISPATTENIGWWITKYWLEFSNASVNCRLQSVNVCRFFGWSLTPFTYELNTIGRTKPNVNLRS